MTEKTQPTDAELWQLHMQLPGQHKDPIDFARSVLALWGQPAHSGEPVAFIHWPINGPPRLVWYSQKALNDAILKTYEGHQPDVKLYTAQPAPWKHDCAALLTNDVELWIDACPHCGKPRNAPQPVERVPLTDGLEMALEQLVNRCNNGHDSSTWDEVIAAEAALERLYKSRAIEAAHGIK